MLKVWGRANSSNVVKVMWCVGELGLPHERIDWGGRFGGNEEPRYSSINPMKRVPTLEEDDGFTLWESHAIVRYLSAKHSPGGLFPDDLRIRAEADKWMDWSSLYLQSFNFAFRMHLFALPEAERKPEEVLTASKKVEPLFAILGPAFGGQALSVWRQIHDGRYSSGITGASLADVRAGASSNGESRSLL